MSSKILSKNLKKLRQQAGLSQDQMARKAGIPYSTYLKIENGTVPNPSIQNVLNIAEALGVSLDELVGRKSSESSSAGRGAFSQRRGTFGDIRQACTGAAAPPAKAPRLEAT